MKKRPRQVQFIVSNQPMQQNRRPIFAGNWKLNLDSKGGCVLVSALLGGLPEDGPTVVVFPTYLAAPSVVAMIKGARIEVGVQDIFYEKWGAFTGEISPAAALAEGINWTLVGHSERRTIIGEGDALLAKKARAALAAGMKVIFCIGETLAEREGGHTFTVLERQIREGLLVADPTLGPNTTVAYEPVWAIGTGRTATPEIAQEAHQFVRSLLAKLAGSEAAEACRILYGGSVNAANVRGLMSQPDIDGALVGGASLKAEEFIRIVRYKE